MRSKSVDISLSESFFGSTVLVEEFLDLVAWVSIAKQNISISRLFHSFDMAADSSSTTITLKAGAHTTISVG
jgi:hypothetical protein